MFTFEIFGFAQIKIRFDLDYNFDNTVNDFETILKTRVCASMFL